MKHVVILGAGFSRFCARAMPLTDELGNKIMKRLGPAGKEKPFEAGGFETWLSRLAEPQPYFNEATNTANRAQFLEISSAVREVIVEAEMEATSSPAKEFLLRLVTILHERRSTVATFNYDTLLERAIYARGLWDHSNQAVVRPEHAIEDRPPLPSMPGLVFSHAHASTFRLLKLHGSSDTFWINGDNSGATINRLDSGAWSSSPDQREQRRLKLPDRVPFIVPPAAGKSAFYANPHTRQLWQEIADALAEADSVDIVGYSLPMTDTVSGGLFSQFLSSNSAKIRIVNPSASQVAANLETLGCSRERMTIISGERPVEDWIGSMELEVRPFEADDSDVESALEQDARVVIATSLHGARTCVGVQEESHRVVLVMDPEEEGVAEIFNRRREAHEREPVLLQQLLDSGVPNKPMVVDYGSAGFAPVVAGRGRPISGEGEFGNWFQLIPSFPTPEPS